MTGLKTEVQPGDKYLEILAQPSVVVEEKKKVPHWCFRKAVSQSANWEKRGCVWFNFQSLRVVINFTLRMICFLVLLSAALPVVRVCWSPLVALVIHWINNLQPSWFGNKAPQPALRTDAHLCPCASSFLPSTELSCTDSPVSLHQHCGEPEIVFTPLLTEATAEGRQTIQWDSAPVR